MKKMLAIKFYPLDYEEILLYTIQDYYWPRNSYLNYFEEPYIPSLKDELHVEVNVVLEDYVEFKEKNIEIFQEINEGIAIEEELKIKIVGEINEELIIEEDFEVKMQNPLKKKLQRKLPMISMKPSKLISKFKLLLF